ncbi:MAG: HAD family phosphatase [Chloroflexota bacterium]
MNRSRLKLAAFDLDGTLNAVTSPYDHVHRALGVVDQAQAVLRRYQRGEISYSEWGKHEVELWRGLPVDELVRITSEIPFRPGAQHFIQRLMNHDVSVVIISAGFEPHVQRCANDLGVEEVYFNRIGIRDGLLTGKYMDGVDSTNKGEILQRIQCRLQVTPDETLVAGDTTHDISLFEYSTMCVAIEDGATELKDIADLVLPNEWTTAWCLIDKLKPGWLPG